MTVLCRNYCPVTETRYFLPYRGLCTVCRQTRQRGVTFNSHANTNWSRIVGVHNELHLRGTFGSAAPFQPLQMSLTMSSTQTREMERTFPQMFVSVELVPPNDHEGKSEWNDSVIERKLTFFQPKGGKSKKRTVKTEDEKTDAKGGTGGDLTKSSRQA